MAISQATEAVCLKRKHDAVGDDITLINKWLDEAQGMFLGQSLDVSMIG